MRRRGIGHLGIGIVIMVEGEAGSTSGVGNRAMTDGEKKIEGREGDDSCHPAIACLTTRTIRNTPLFRHWS